MIVKIKITQEDIDCESHGCTTCPAARAINRELQQCCEALVGPGAIEVRVRGVPMAVADVCDIPVPDALIDWITNYDHNRDASPAVFALDIPERYLRKAV